MMIKESEVENAGRPIESPSQVDVRQPTGLVKQSGRAARLKVDVLKPAWTRKQVYRWPAHWWKKADQK